MKKKNKLIIAFLLLFLICIIIALFLPKKEKSIETKEYVKIPNVVGEKSNIGKEILEKLGFRVSIKEIEDESQEDMIGKIYKQSKTGKSSKNAKVIIYVYVTSEEVKLPDVIGMKVEEAKDLLEKLGFNVSLKEKEDKDKEEGIVVEQECANQEKIVKGSTITLTYIKNKEQEEENKDNLELEDNKKEEIESTPSKNYEETQNNTSSTPSKPQEVTYTVTITGTNIHRKGYGPFQLKATVSPSLPQGKKIVWSSSNSNVARVSSTGVITPVANYGRATITAKIEGTNYSGSKNISVLGIKGDLDGNGAVNTSDAALIYDFMRYPNEVVKSLADVNGDGVINEQDANKIMNYYLTGQW